MASDERAIEIAKKLGVRYTLVYRAHLYAERYLMSKYGQVDEKRKKKLVLKWLCGFLPSIEMLFGKT
ncbi:MAG: hypothetical protein JZD41_02420 [Thermoproteus sp.]|nr:hypothetical protein [Thermoproteus sp.]